MEYFTTALSSTLTPQMIMALIGGLIGTNMSSDVKLYGWRLTILTAIISMSLVGVSSEYISYKWGVTSLIGHFAQGCLAGMVGMRLLDAIRLALPDFMHTLASLASKTALELVVDLFNKVRKILKL